MANEVVKWADFADGLLTTGISDTDTDLVSPGFVNFPTFEEYDYMWITLDPNGDTPEVVKVIAHLEASDTITVEREQGQYPAQTWAADTEWVVPWLKADAEFGFTPTNWNHTYWGYHGLVKKVPWPNDGWVMEVHQGDDWEDYQIGPGYFTAIGWYTEQGSSENWVESGYSEWEDEVQTFDSDGFAELYTWEDGAEVYVSSHTYDNVNWYNGYGYIDANSYTDGGEAVLGLIAYDKSFRIGVQSSDRPIPGVQINIDNVDWVFGSGTPTPTATITGSRSADTVQVLTDLLAALDEKGIIIDETTS